MKPHLLLAVLALAPVLRAETILNETFTDLDRTDGTDALDSQWYVISNQQNNTISATTSKLVLGSTGNTAINPHAVTTFPSQTLTTGQTISVSFNFNSTSTASATGIRFGLYNSGSTSMTGDIFGTSVLGQPAIAPATGSIFKDDTGYSVFAPHLGTGTQNIAFRSRPANNTTNTLQVANDANVTISSQALATATTTTSTYNASLSLTRTATGYDYTVEYAGTTFTGSTTTVNTSTFDTLSIFGAVIENKLLTIDDIIVTSTATPAESSLITWRDLQGLPQDGSQDLLNPSGDGASNLLKYALNLAPNAGDLAISNNHPLANPNGTTVSELTGLPMLTLDGTSHAVFTYIRRKAATSPGVSYTVHWSDALESWAPNESATEATLSLDTTWERVTLTDSFTTTQKPKRFAKLLVSTP